MTTLNLHDFWNTDPTLNYYNDFSTAADLADFTGTAVLGGTATIAVGVNGKLGLAGAATTNLSGYQIQQKTYQFSLIAERTIAQRWLINEAMLDVEWAIGLAAVSTTVLASQNIDGIYLYGVPTSNTVKLYVVKGGVAVTYTVASGLRNPGVDQMWGLDINVQRDTDKAVINVHLNGKIIWTSDPKPTASMPTVPLCVTAAMRSGSTTGTQSLWLDYTQTMGPRT